MFSEVTTQQFSPFLFVCFESLSCAEIRLSLWSHCNSAEVCFSLLLWSHCNSGDVSSSGVTELSRSTFLPLESVHLSRCVFLYSHWVQQKYTSSLSAAVQIFFWSYPNPLVYNRLSTSPTSDLETSRAPGGRIFKSSGSITAGISQITHLWRRAVAGCCSLGLPRKVCT